MGDRLELPQGTLDLLILKTLSLGPQHGWAISERLHQVSRATVQIPQGSLYPALHQLERETEKYVRTGMLRHEAERQARLAFGGLDRIKDDARDARGLSLLDSLT